MQKRYRLRPKPGVTKTNRAINTGPTRPVIVAGQPNTVKVQKPQEQRPVAKRALIKKPQKDPIQRQVQSRANRAKIQRPKNVRSKPPIRSSPLKRKKEIEIGKYRKSVQGLKDIGVGRVLVMVACGPSIEEADLPKLAGHSHIDIMSINKPDSRLHPTKYWIFCDQSQFTRNKEAFNAYKGTLLNAWSVRARHANQVLIRNISGKGFSKDLLQGFYIGRSTTFSGMQVAHWMNYDQVYIFGCDMCKPPGFDKLHFYGVNPDVDPGIRAQRFSKEAEHYSAGARALTAEERNRFVFCSAYNPWPFIKEFQQMDHREAVDHILKVAALKANPGLAAS